MPLPDLLLPQSVALGRWGYLRPDGSWAMPPQFAFAWPFSEGVAAVRKSDRMGYLRPDGSEALPFRYLRAGKFEKGRSEVETETGMGVIRPDGSFVLEPRFEFIWRQEWKGRDVFRTDGKDGRHALYDFDGNEILPPRADDFFGTLAKLAHRGRLEHLGYGLYRIDKFVPNANGLDAYACAVARFGAGACLWGPSVLAARGLCPTDPARIFVAVPGRFRGRVPAGIVLKQNTPCPAPDNLEGIPVQPVDAAILSSQHVVELTRLLEAVDAAKVAGLLDDARARNTVKELYKHD